MFRPVGVVGVWNTFFPDSSWDEGRMEGREGTQTMNVVVLVDVQDKEVQKEGMQSGCMGMGMGMDMDMGVGVGVGSVEWAVSASKWVSARECLEPGRYDKYVSLNVQKALQRGLLTLYHCHTAVTLLKY